MADTLAFESIGSLAARIRQGGPPSHPNWRQESLGSREWRRRLQPALAGSMGG
jgi:hypothetical protein